MEFGRVPENQLINTDFSLSSDRSINERVLTGKRSTRLKIHIGCAKWGRQEWIGKLYPVKTREKDYLEYYSRNYNSIEFNATHYKIYGPAAILKWAAIVSGKDFIFTPKMYQGITHRGNFQAKNFLTTEFLRGIMAFGEHLGPVFIQVHERFSPARKKELFDYLDSLPQDMSFFLEVRHAGWFGDEATFCDLSEHLRRTNKGLVLTDTAGRRDCCHMALTVPKAFIRYVGNSLHPSDYNRCDAWIRRIKQWIDCGLEELYFFMHMHDETYSPELSVYLINKLNALCNLDIQKPVFVDTDLHLFA